MRNTLVNAVMFNVSWFAILATHATSIALLVAGLHVTLHMYLMGRGRHELMLIGAALVLGLALDQVLFASGIFTLAGAAASAPLWLSCLWPVFATTLGHAFSSLWSRPFLAACLGAAGGTGSYLAGAGMTPIDFVSPVWGPLTIALLWALLFPALCHSAGRLFRATPSCNGFAAT